MKIDGDAIRHRLLVGGEIGNDGFKSIRAKVFLKLFQVRRLILSLPLETIHDEAEQLETGVVLIADVLIGLENVLRAERSPLSGFQGDHQEIRRTECRVGDQRDVSRAVQQDVIVERGQLAEWINQ